MTNKTTYFDPETMSVGSITITDDETWYNSADGVEKSIIAEKVGVSKATLYRYLVYKGLFTTKSKKFRETGIFY